MSLRQDPRLQRILRCSLSTQPKGLRVVGQPTCDFRGMYLDDLRCPHPETFGLINIWNTSRKSETLWEEAVEGLKEEERKLWDSYSASQIQVPAGRQYIDEQISLIRETRDDLTDKQLTIQRSDGRVIIVREKINSVLKVMDKYMAIGDIAIQHSPRITALVWAGVRLGLQVGGNDSPTNCTYKANMPNIS